MPDDRTGAVPEPRKIALFGGTFDPVHLGHRHVAEEALKAFELDEVRFIPCRISPHKAESSPASTEDRLAMLRLAMADAPWAVVDDLELRRDGPSFSYETAEVMRKRFPTAKFYWIMGTDQWEALPRWKNPDRLAQCVEFIVVNRGGFNPSPHGFAMHSIKTHHPASATEIREALARGEKNHTWLHPDVANYIRAHHLYGA